MSLKFFVACILIFPMWLYAADPSVGPSSERALNYSINVAWTNKSLDPEQEYIMPSTRSDTFFRNVKGWFELNPRATISVWYDGLYTTKDAVDRTLAKFNEMLGGTHERLVMKNFRMIPTVVDNEKIFSNKEPVYLRSDLQRVIAGVYSIEVEGQDRYIFANDTVQPMSKDDLFDPKTEKDLSTFGMVMARSTKAPTMYENNFFIMNRDPVMLHGVKIALINLTMDIARYNLRETIFYKNGAKEWESYPEIVWWRYKDVYSYISLMKKVNPFYTEYYMGSHLETKKTHTHLLEFLEKNDPDLVRDKTLIFGEYLKTGMLLGRAFKFDSDIPKKEINVPAPCMAYDDSCFVGNVPPPKVFVGGAA